MNGSGVELAMPLACKTPAKARVVEPILFVSPDSGSADGPFFYRLAGRQYREMLHWASAKWHVNFYILVQICIPLVHSSKSPVVLIARSPGAIKFVLIGEIGSKRHP